ncbi:hypothetical protein [Niastella populi]|nr:hypothetical protein [Niastella populi]
MRRTILLQQTIGETGRSGLAISINEKTGEGVTDTSMQAAGYRQSIAP